MRYLVPSSLLRRALLADAAITAVVGLVQVADADTLANALALPRALLTESGAVMVAYAVLLVALRRAARLPAAVCAAFAGGNVLWALAVVAPWAEGLLAPSATGEAWLLMHALGALGLAGWEFAGIRGSTEAPAPAGARMRPDW